MKSVKQYFEIYLDNLTDEKKTDVLYYNIFLAIVAELKLDKYFEQSSNYEYVDEILYVVGGSFRLTLNEKLIRDCVSIKTPMQIWDDLGKYYFVRKRENIPIVILIDELIQEFTINNLIYDEEVVKQFYTTFKKYLMPNPEDLKDSAIKDFSEKLGNLDLSINWEKVDYLFSIE